MKRLIIPIIILAAIAVPLLVQGGCTSCGDDEPTWSDNQVFQTSATDGGLDCADARPYISIVATTSGILIGVALILYTWLAKDAPRKKKDRAFKWGLIPALLFFMQSIFCVGAGFLIGCIYSVFTSSFGLLCGIIFSV